MKLLLRNAIAVFAAAAGVCSLSLVGCTGTGEQIEETKLVGLIVDLHVLEARHELVADIDDSLRDSVLAAHGVTQKQFETSIAYYADKPDDYVSLYNRVIDSLSAEEAQLEQEGVIGLLPPP